MISKSYKEIIAGLQAKKWYIACKAEYNSQIAQSIFIIRILPYNQKTINRKWVFKPNKNLDSFIQRYKAR